VAGAGDGDEKASKPVADRPTYVERKEPTAGVIFIHPPPGFSKKTYAIGFILCFCVAVAIRCQGRGGVIQSYIRW
jgi:hypothetical protein